MRPMPRTPPALHGSPDHPGGCSSAPALVHSDRPGRCGRCREHLQRKATGVLGSRLSAVRLFGGFFCVRSQTALRRAPRGFTGRPDLSERFRPGGRRGFILDRFGKMQRGASEKFSEINPPYIPPLSGSVCRRFGGKDPRPPGPVRRCREDAARRLVRVRSPVGGPCPRPVRRDASSSAAAGGAASDRCRRREHSAARVRGVRFASSGEARFRHPQRFTVRTSARFRFAVMLV